MNSIHLTTDNFIQMHFNEKTTNPMYWYDLSTANT